MFSNIMISQFNMKNIYKQANIYGGDTEPRNKAL